MDIITYTALKKDTKKYVDNKLESVLSDYTKQDGYYESLTAGNLTTNVSETDKEPYNFRTSGGSLDIGAYEDDTIVGGTLGWNQLVDDTTYTLGLNISATKTGHKFEITTTQTAASIMFDFNGKITDHKYLIAAKASYGQQNAPSYIRIRLGNSGNYVDFTSIPSTETRFAKILDGDSVSTTVIRFIFEKIGTWVLEDVNVYDLTLLFGSTIADYIYSLEQGNAGDGVAFFKKYFPKPYYSYNAGTLESVQTSKHEMAGFNLFDLKTFADTYSDVCTYSNGELTVSSWKGALYTVGVPVNIPADLTNGAYISVELKNGTSTGIKMGVKYDDGSVNLTYTPTTTSYVKCERSLSNKRIVAVYFDAASVGSFSVKNCCINLHWDGERDGEYEPYVKHSYDLDPITLNGIFKLDSNNNLYTDGDVYKSDGTVTRKYTESDMGEMEWSYITNDGDPYFRTSRSGRKAGSFNVKTTKYVTNTAQGTSNLNDKQIIGSASGTYIYLKDSAYTDAQTLTTSLSGVKLLWELETPTTESAEPFTKPQWVDNWGTEEYVDYGVSQNTRDVAIPVGHETIYPVDLKAKLETLPNVPSGDGLYLMKQESGENSYQQYVSPVPNVPNTDGNYVLKCTVSGGIATLTWESE